MLCWQKSFFKSYMNAAGPDGSTDATANSDAILADNFFHRTTGKT